jgi:AAA ATPase domain
MNSREVERGRPRLVLIEGPAGIGKTNLARRFLADHPQAGVRSAHADEVETNLPYGVLEQLFGELRGRPVTPAWSSHRWRWAPGCSTPSASWATSGS